MIDDSRLPILQPSNAKITFDDTSYEELFFARAATPERPLSGATFERTAVPDTERRDSVRVIGTSEDDALVLRIDVEIETHGFRPHRTLKPVCGAEVRLVARSFSPPFLCLHLHKEWWTRPVVAHSAADIPERTQMLLARVQEGTTGKRKSKSGNAREEPALYAAILTCASGDCTATLAGVGGAGDLATAPRPESEGRDEHSAVRVVLSSYQAGNTSWRTTALAAGTGNDPFVLIERLSSALIRSAGLPARLRPGKPFPAPLEYLGWCTWDAFYTDVSRRGIEEKAAELTKKSVPVRWMIVDDGWLQVDGAGLTSFAPRPDRFPGGFHSLTRELKSTYGIRWVGVWHAVSGYWGGVAPGSELEERFRGRLARTPSGKLVPDPDRSLPFWNEWYEELRRAGIDFLKVDGQCGMKFQWAFGKKATVAAASALAQQEAAAGRAFENRAIHCMSMSNEVLWSHGSAPVVRNSDDFVPDSRDNYKEMALENAFNALYHGTIYHTDWDMFWTDHPDATTNAMLRAVSGGPVYISDKVGRTVPEVIRPLVDNDGKVLRCDRPGMPTVDCLFRRFPSADSGKRNETDVAGEAGAGQIPGGEAGRRVVDEPGHALKIWNTVNGAGIIGAFNIDPYDREVTCTIGPRDFPPLSGEGAEARFLVYDHAAGTSTLLRSHQDLHRSVVGRGARIFCVVPLTAAFVPVGRLDKYVSPALAGRIVTMEGTILIHAPGPGIYGIWTEVEPQELRMDGRAAEYTRDASGLIRIPLPVPADDSADHVIEVRFGDSLGR